MTLPSIQIRNYTMSQPNPSELQKASENVNPDQLADNLDKDNHNNQAAKPQPLDSQENTPFIDDSLRTDK